MASVYKRSRSYPIPEGAEIVTCRGRLYAKWIDPAGTKERAPLNAKGDKIVRESQYYLIAYFDHDGKRRKVYTRYGDKDAALQYANRLEQDAEDRRRGLIDPSLERFAAQRQRPIYAHTEDFRAVLQAKGNTAQHIDGTIQRARAIVDACGAKHLPELTASAVLQAIKDLRDSGKSLETCNSYIRSIKAFSRWLHRDGRTPDHVLVSIPTFNAATDPRHTRRKLTPEELAWLLPIVEGYTAPCHHLPGPDRAMLYRLALGTGFRAGELRSLTPESFALASDPPTVTVDAAYSKRRRQDVQPIRRDLAELLRGWLQGRPSGKRLFNALPDHTARMLRADLKAARAAWIAEAKSNDSERQRRESSDFLRYRDAAGRVADFHSTRHTFVSGIVASGASVKTAQELARHSTPVLTIGRYSHARLHDLTAALEALPDLRATRESESEPNRSALQATGTDDGVVRPNAGEHHAGQLSGKTWREVAQSDQSEGPVERPVESQGTISFPTKTQGKLKRRARDSNPQPHKGRRISNAVASHSHTLQLTTNVAVAAVCRGS